MRHEMRIIERLAGVPGVSRPRSTGLGAVLVLRDGGQTSLADSARISPVELVGYRLRFGLGVCRLKSARRVTFGGQQ
jgi:hypothetical protein